MSTAELVEIVLDIDLDRQPECEGLNHPNLSHGHAVGPATYLLQLHCGGVIQLCTGRVGRMLQPGTYTLCGDCHARVPYTDLVFIEL